MPLTQILMTQQDITLNVGPEGIFAKIVMNASGISFSVMGGLTTEQWSPAGIASMAPTISETALAAISHDGAGGRDGGDDAQHAGARRRRGRRQRHPGLRGSA